jgi:hypothetical protein
MPEKVKQLEAAWQRQTDRFTELAQQSRADRPQPEAAQGKAKGQPQAE